MNAKNIEKRIVRELTPEGNISLGYVCDEIPCMHIELTDHAAISAAKHQLIFKEMEFCEALLNMYLAKLTAPTNGIKTHRLDNEIDLTLRAAYVSAVVTYGKAFTQPGKGRMRLDQSKVFKDDGSGFREFHTWIMEVHRHEYVAHAGVGELEDSRTVLIFHPPHMGTNWRLVLPHATFSASPHPDDARDFLIIVCHVKAWVEREIDKLAKHVLQETLKNPVAHYYPKAVYATTKAPPLPAPTIQPHLATQVDNSQDGM